MVLNQLGDLFVQHRLVAHQFWRDTRRTAWRRSIFPETVSRAAALLVEFFESLTKRKMHNPVTHPHHCYIMRPKRCTDPEKQRKMCNARRV